MSGKGQARGERSEERFKVRSRKENKTGRCKRGETKERKGDQRDDLKAKTGSNFRVFFCPRSKNAYLPTRTVHFIIIHRLPFDP